MIYVVLGEGEAGQDGCRTLLRIAPGRPLGRLAPAGISLPPVPEDFSPARSGGLTP